MQWWDCFLVKTKSLDNLDTSIFTWTRMFVTGHTLLAVSLTISSSVSWCWMCTASLSCLLSTSTLLWAVREWSPVRPSTINCQHNKPCVTVLLLLLAQMCMQHIGNIISLWYAVSNKINILLTSCACASPNRALIHTPYLILRTRIIQYA